MTYFLRLISENNLPFMSSAPSEAQSNYNTICSILARVLFPYFFVYFSDPQSYFALILQEMLSRTIFFLLSFAFKIMSVFLLMRRINTYCDDLKLYQFIVYMNIRNLFIPSPLVFMTSQPFPSMALRIQSTFSSHLVRSKCSILDFLNENFFKYNFYFNIYRSI